MKKAILRVLCLLLGLNVFTACYGPAVPDRHDMEAELAAQADESTPENAPEGDPESETE